MAFYLDDRHVYRVPELDSFDWLIHGFGTRQANIPALFSNLATVKQVHSATCVEACGRSGVLVDEWNRAVSAVHSGWRGTAAGIVARAVDLMGERFGTKVAGLHAAIGPAIGKCCYEVGPEVAAQFGIEGRTYLDLPEINRAKLAEIGIPADRIYVSQLCTMCCAEEFHSFRRDKEAAGRLYSYVGLRALQ
jgi:YfiH family protein